MAFSLAFTLGGYTNQPPVEQAKVTASEAYTEGEALALSSGAATKASGTTMPTLMAMQSKTAASSGKVFVHTIMPEYVYRTTFSADASAVAEGAKVTLSSDGLSVTATTTSGVATIYRKLGSGASGTQVLVRFC